MSECKDPDIGRLLHAYELHSLSEQDTEAFEIHLLKCEHCFGELNEFKQESDLLLNDKDVRKRVESSLASDGAKPSFMRKVARYLWPHVPLIFKPALAYLILLIALPSTYYLVNKSGEPEKGFVQRIALSDIRSGTDETHTIAPDVWVVLLEFKSANAVAGKTYRIVIDYEETGKTVWSTDFDGFNELGWGCIGLSPDILLPGQYKLTITDPESDRETGVQIHYFSVGP